MNKNRPIYKLLVVVLLFAHCVKPYTPPVLEAKNNYVVVDGFINTGANQITTITLTRTRNLTDTFTILPESNASVVIQSSDGRTYLLTERANGVYQSAVLNLSTANTYQLKITTSDGKQYSSYYVECKQTAPIDSLTWEQQDDVTVYLYTHDPANNTHYYKWDYTETWQYNSQLQGIYILAGNLIVKSDSATQIDSCWQGDESKEIVLGSSINLSEDVISHAKIAVIPQSDERIDYRYSILVRQRAISAEAYSYWQIVQKNSQDRGGFFDLQPGQLKGNLHCDSDPTEPIIGFINASTEQDYRMFINHREVEDWVVGGEDCLTITIPQNPVDFRLYDYPDPLYAPYYFTSGGGIVLAKKVCLDCTLHGGTNKRPAYW